MQSLELTTTLKKLIENKHVYKRENRRGGAYRYQKEADKSLYPQNRRMQRNIRQMYNPAQHDQQGYDLQTFERV